MGSPEEVKPAVEGNRGEQRDVINYKATGRPNRGLRAGSRNSQ